MTLGHDETPAEDTPAIPAYMRPYYDTPAELLIVRPSQADPRP